MNQLLTRPLLGLTLSIAAYFLGIKVRDKVKSPLANPLILAVALIIALISLTPLTLEGFQAGGSTITLFIVPATICLALQIHRQWKELRENLFPILAGCLVGSLTSVASVWAMCRFFLIDEVLTASLLPKSVTSAIALELAEKNGGIGAIAVTAVVFTGIACILTAPLIVKLLKLKDPVATGVALGTAGHAIATSRALELGEVQGAMSGIALSLTGVLTSLLFLVLPIA